MIADAERGIHDEDEFKPGADLSGRDLSGQDLSGRNLSGANLEKAKLQGCNLTGTYLDGANLKGADLSSANLHLAVLGGADLSNADLANANLERCNLVGVKAHEANFEQVKLYYSRPSNGDFTGSNFKYADIERAIFRKANVSFCDFSETSGTANFENANREGMKE